MRMATKLTGLFGTRRMAELAVERLVQEYKVKREDILIGAAVKENTAGVNDAKDQEAGFTDQKDMDEAALNGEISVSVAIAQEDVSHRIRLAFNEFKASEVDSG
jgi:hypothetical protein